MNFSDNLSGSCKRNVSEILDGSEVLTASYPRKRHNYALPEKPSTVSYYPKDSSEKRCASGPMSAVDSSTCWPSSSSSQTLSTKMPGNKAAVAWKPWQSHSSSKSSLVNAPARRKSSKPPYVHPPLLTGAPPKFAPERQVRHGRSGTPGSSNFKKRGIKDVNIGAKPILFSKAEVKKTASVDSDEDQRPHVTGKAANNSTDRQPPPVRNLSNLLAPVQCSELVGQSILSSPHSGVRTAIASAAFTNIIFWGPPGCGKSCMRSILARRCSATDSGWRFSSTSGMLLASEHIRQVVKSTKASKHDRLLLFVDDLHCSLPLVQNMLASCLDDSRVVLVGTSLTHPRTSLSAALVSRCDLYEFHALQVSHLDIILRRALKRLQISVLNREMELKDVLPKTQEVKLGCKASKDMQAIPILPEDSAKCSDQKQAPRHQESVKCGGPAGDKLITKPPVADQSGSGSILGSAVKVEPSEVKKERDRADDNGIEDMSDEEDESILDVLTKDLDKISDEYKIEHEGEREDDKLVPNDLDCVSDDELSEHGEAQHFNSLESIDSSEDDLDGENASCLRAIGMTQGAMSVLCQESWGDSRVLLRVLQRLVGQASASSASSQPLRLAAEPPLHQRTDVQSDRKMSSSKNHREERRKSESGALRIANYGSKDSKNERVVTYVENDPSLNTDDISSDEDNEADHVKHNNSNQAHVNVKVDDLDNVSDISDNSVNISRNYDGQNPTGKTITDNIPKTVGSDESLSSDILDYEEIEEDFDSENETENLNILSDNLRDPLGSNSVKRSSAGLHSHSRSSDHSSHNVKKERSLLRGSVSSVKVGSVKCKQLDSVGDDGLVNVKSTNPTAGRTMTIITAKLVRQAFQADEDSSLRRAVEAGIRGGDESVALLALARLLREKSVRAAAELLLEAAISCVGVGDSNAVGRAVTTLEAVQHVTEPHARNLVANTVVFLTRATKDESAITGLAAAERQIEVASSLPPHAASAQESIQECA